MIYAIHTQTKEHRAGAIIKSPYWTWVEADADGWIEWRGNVCPLPKGARCDIKSKAFAKPVIDMDGACLDWRLVGYYRPIPQAEENQEQDELVIVDFAESSGNRNVSLGSIKAQWQAEALESEAAKVYRAMKGANHFTDRLVYLKISRSIRETADTLRRRAEA